MTLTLPLDRGWSFRRLPITTSADSGSCVGDLPHNPFTAGLDGEDHWFGECEYRRTVSLPARPTDGCCTLFLGAAMHSAIVFADGVECGRHSGGYLPFEVDLTDAIRRSGDCEISIR